MINLIASLYRATTQRRLPARSHRRTAACRSWEQQPQRGTSRAADQHLSAFAILWLEGISHQARPRHMADMFPRIVNRIALCWRDVALTERVLDGLLVDHRGGRCGFPSDVVNELLRLHALHERRTSPASSDTPPALTLAWEPHLQASVDR